MRYKYADPSCYALIYGNVEMSKHYCSRITPKFYNYGDNWGTRNENASVAFGMVDTVEAYDRLGTLILPPIDSMHSATFS